MSWRDHQFSWVFEVGESSKGDDPKGGVVVYPRVVQDARLCFRMMGVSFKGTEKGFLDFLILVDEGAVLCLCS
jgi:DNA helicase HerA-like ATPase